MRGKGDVLALTRAEHFLHFLLHIPFENVSIVMQVKYSDIQFLAAIRHGIQNLQFKMDDENGAYTIQWHERCV